MQSVKEIYNNVLIDEFYYKLKALPIYQIIKQENFDLVIPDIIKNINKEDNQIIGESYIYIGKKRKYIYTIPKYIQYWNNNHKPIYNYIINDIVVFKNVKFKNNKIICKKYKQYSYGKMNNHEFYIPETFEDVETEELMFTNTNIAEILKLL